MEKFIMTFNDGSEEEVRFILSPEGILTCRVPYPYFVDTIMENAEEYLYDLRDLCVYGRTNLRTTNIREFIRFILKNRFDIELELRGGFKKTWKK